VLQALLDGPLYGGMAKLKPSGFVAAAARVARLGGSPKPRWLNKYMAQLQVGGCCWGSATAQVFKQGAFFQHVAQTT
jgi:hypothetical protein